MAARHVRSTRRAQAAGRDINNNNTTINPPSQVELSEPQRQADFARLTGIRCCKQAREWLTDLTEHHGFVMADLAIAWKAGTLGWDAERGEPKVRLSRLEVALGWLLVLAVGLLCLMQMLDLIWVRGASQIIQAVGMTLTVLIYLGAIWMSFRFLIGPQRVGGRIARIKPGQERSVKPVQGRIDGFGHLQRLIAKHFHPACFNRSG